MYRVFLRLSFDLVPRVLFDTPSPSIKKAEETMEMRLRFIQLRHTHVLWNCIYARKTIDRSKITTKWIEGNFLKEYHHYSCHIGCLLYWNYSRKNFTQHTFLYLICSSLAPWAPWILAGSTKRMAEEVRLQLVARAALFVHHKEHVIMLLEIWK